MAERKKFIEVNVPILQSEVSVLGTMKDLDNRTIKLDLSRKLRGKGVMMTLQIFNVDDKELIAIPKKIELMRSYLARVIRKRTDNVEDSINLHCLDVRATVKPFLITRKRVSRAVRKNLRNTAREFLINYAKEKKYNELCNEILSGTLQKNLLPKLKKVYPLAFCEIRIIESKDLLKIDLKEIMNDDLILEKEDTQEVETEIEGKIEQEILEEAIEEAEEENDDDETQEEDSEEIEEDDDETQEEDSEEIEEDDDETQEEDSEEIEEEDDETQEEDSEEIEEEVEPKDVPLNKSKEKKDARKE